MELIFFSVDKTESAAKKWSQKEKFPWPQVFYKNQSKDWSFMKYPFKYIPHYLLVDKKGVKITEGLGAIMKKIDTL